MIHFTLFTLLMLLMFFVETVVKTEEQDESAIDMFDDEFHAIIEQDFSAKKNPNEKSDAEIANEEHETDSNATEIDEDDDSTVSGQLFVGIHFIF